MMMNDSLPPGAAAQQGAVVPMMMGGGGPQQQQQQQQQQQPVAVAQQQQQQQQQQVSLSHLMDFLVQRVYHELTVLAELLPRKTDLERKMEIFNFASRTRMLLVRLLALVKWASSASKVDKCNGIMIYLERQSNLFTETADSLATMARETLVRATLPNFHLPAAVEVLTTGYYSRVPRCVRDRIVPGKPVSRPERKQVLQKLNQVIEHRLVTTTGGLPAAMRNLKVDKGRVTFVVENEFAVSLTVMGDGSHLPWRLLKIEILVEDKETAGEAKSLVHSLQVQYLEQLVQSRLQANENLVSVYNTLHAFCQSLQLEVLHSQTQKLCYERLGEYVRIEEYRPGRCLTVSYWRHLLGVSKANDLGYRFSVQVDSHDKPLSVVHMPPLTCQKDTELTEKAIRSEHLSVERLLVHSIYVRTRARLTELKTEVQARLLGQDVEASLHGTPPVLSIPILQPCLRSEQLLVTVDTHTGIFLAHVPQHEDNPFSGEIQTTLNEDRSKLEWLVSQLRYWITKQRVHKTLQQLPATPYERLPILFDLNKHPLKDLSPNRMYIRLHRQPNAILIVEFHEKVANKCEIDYTYYFLWVKPASIEDDPKDDSVTADIPKVYLKALSMVEYDPFLVTHATQTKVDVQELSERIIGKRKLGGKVEVPFKRTKYPAYFIYDLAHVVAFTDERIPFNSLAQELTKKGVSHTGVEIEDKAIGLAIKIVQFPPPIWNAENVEDRAVVRKLQRYLLSVCVRMQQRGGRFWRTEMVFVGNPVAKIHNNSKNGSRQTSYITHEVGSAENMGEIVDSLIQEWSQMVHLFGLVDDLEDYLACDSVSDIMDIKSYNFRELILEFGPNHKSSVKVQWSGALSKFQLVFGGTSESAGMCPHNIIKEQLEQHLNQHKSLALLGTLLHETYGAVRALARLPTTPQMGVALRGVNPPVQTFSIIPQSPTHYKVIFYNSYCLDIRVRSGGLILIRDAAISLFDQRKAMEDVQPIPFIKNFLMRYVDESAAALHRRQSQSAEDDNPPSPMNIGGGDSDSSSHNTGASSSGGLRFHAPHTPPSNPLTPASPHGFLQSPPGIRQTSPAPQQQMPHASPGQQQQPTPSPGGFTVPSPANPVGSVGSPFPSAQSPMAVGSPGLNRPSPRPLQSPHSMPGSHGGSHTGGHGSMSSQVPTSRLLPQRLWAGATPTPLTSKAFDDICKPSPLPPINPGQQQQQQQQVGMMLLAPLHRFLGCVFLRRFMQQHIRNEDYITALPSPEPGVIMFRVEGLTCKVISYPSNQHQSLHLKVEPEPAYAMHWSPDMIHILEKFFDTRVAAPPFRPNTLTAFCRILQCPIEPLKDLIEIIRYEMMPELVAKNNLKWSCRLCLTMPPAAPLLMPLGQPGLLRLKEKMLMFLHLTRANINHLLPPGTEPLSVVIPIVYDIEQKQTTVAQKEMNPVINAAQQHFAALARSGQLNLQRCTILPSVYDLLRNLSLPNEGPPTPAQVPQVGVPGFNQGGPPPPGVMVPGGGPPMQGQMAPYGGGPPMRPMNPNMMQQRMQQPNPMGQPMGQHPNYMGQQQAQ